MKLFLLTCGSYDDALPVAVYSDRERATAEASRLERRYLETNPAFSAWCDARWKIVVQWRAEGRIKDEPLNLPGDAGEREIVTMLGPCPPIEGYDSCAVQEVENRLE